MTIGTCYQNIGSDFYTYQCQAPLLGIPVDLQHLGHLTAAVC